MNKTEVMNALKAAANETCRKTYERHGVGESIGVRYGDLYKIVKKIGIDQKLAEQLWATGIHDARTVATMICDPQAVKVSTLDAWVKTVNNPLTLDAVAMLAMKSPHALRCFEKWTASRNEWIAATGWQVLSGGCCGRPGAKCDQIESQSDAFFRKQIKHIEESIHGSANRVRYGMNGALIAISMRSKDLYGKALAAAKRIGPVEVDHGDTECKTPNAVAYIEKMAARSATRKKTATTKKKTTGKAAAKKKTVRKKTSRTKTAAR